MTAFHQLFPNVVRVMLGHHRLLVLCNVDLLIEILLLRFLFCPPFCFAVFFVLHLCNHLLLARGSRRVHWFIVAYIWLLLAVSYSVVVSCGAGDIRREERLQCSEMVAGVDRRSVQLFCSHLPTSVDCFPLVALAVKCPLTVERFSFGLSNNLIDIMARHADGVATAHFFVCFLVGPLCKTPQYFAVAVSVFAELSASLSLFFLPGLLLAYFSRLMRRQYNCILLLRFFSVEAAPMNLLKCLRTLQYLPTSHPCSIS